MVNCWQRYKGNSMEKGQSFKHIVLEQLDIITEKLNIDQQLILYTKINSKYGYRPKCKTYDYETCREKYFLFELGKLFLNMTPKSWFIKFKRLINYTL